MMRLAAFVLAFLAVSLPLHFVSAQDSTSPTFPDVAIFGEGWSGTGELSETELFGSYGSIFNDDAFDGISGQAYWGPEGSRISVISITLSSSEVAIRQGWENAQQLQYMLSASIDPDVSIMMDETTVLPECDEVERIGGTELGTTLPVGSTLCAPDADTIILVQVAGTVNGQTGVEASDSIVQSLLS